MKPTLSTALSLLLVAIGVGSSSPPAAAQQSSLQNAVGACNGALPGYEGALRKRPLAIANEGTTDAFVSCTLAADPLNNAGNTIVRLNLVNRSSALVAMSCTFVSGSAPEPTSGPGPLYYTKNIALAAGEGKQLEWASASYSLPRFSPVSSTSCSLPPGVEITAMIAIAS